MTTVQPVPPGMHSLTPHIVCRDAAAAIDFYMRAFAAVDLARLPGPDGRLVHALIRIGDSPLFLMDEFAEWGAMGPQGTKGLPVVLHLYVEDADATLANAVAAGAKVVMPLADMFWGDRYGQVEDPFGYRWAIATHIRDVTPEELAAGAAMGCGEAQP
jgi:PhnB protein